MTVIQGQDPLSYLGVRSANPPAIVETTRSPTTTDVNFIIGTIWINTVAASVFELVALLGPVATWAALGTGAVGGITTLTGDDAVPVTPTAGNVNVVGTAGQGITSSGAGSTLTFTVADATTIQKGVTLLASNAESIAGVVTTKAVTPDDLKAKLGTQTNHGVLVGAGTAAAVTALAVGTNGQVLVGSTAANPVFATITQGTGIKTTLGAGTLTISSTGNGTSFVTPGGASQAMAINTTYLSNNVGLLTFTLPAAAGAPAGSVVQVIGQGAGGWQIAQNALQSISVNGSASTIGVTGHVDSANASDTLTLTCVDAGLTWITTSLVGNPSVT